MSDDKKPEQPLQNPQVDVKVIPKDKKDPDHRRTAEKIKRTLEEKVKKTLDDNKSGGKEKQFEGADSEIKKAKESASPQQVEKIDVSVGGTNQDGDKEKREWSVTPKENKSTP